MKVRPARSEGVSLGTVIVVVLVLLLGFAWFAHLPPFTQQEVITPSSQSTPQSTTPAICDPTQPRLLETVVSHYSSANALTSPTVKYYINQGGSYVLLPAGNSPGSVAEGTPAYSVQTWSLSQGILAVASAAGAYPVEGILGQPMTMGGVTVLSTSCATVNQNNYFVNAFTLLQAPGSGTSSTSNTFAFVFSNNGASLTAKTTPVPTSPTVWNVQLKITQAFTGTGHTYTIYSTSDNPVYNYATQQAGNAQVTTTLLIFANATGLSITGNGVQPINSRNIQQGTSAWVVTGFNGCIADATATPSNPYTCLNVPITVQETIPNTGHHVAIYFIFVDNQQLAWILNNAVDPAPGSFTGGTNPTTAGSYAGIPSGFSFLTPTGGNNAGNPAPFVEQYYLTILSY